MFSPDARRSFVERVDERFLCPCCRFVFTGPTRFPCGNAHAFCLACAETWFDSSGARGVARADVPCPMCRCTARGSGRSVERDDALEAALRETRAACDCGASVVLSEASRHYETCEITRAMTAPRSGARTPSTSRRRVARDGGRGNDGAASSDADVEIDADEIEADETDVDEMYSGFLCTLCAAAFLRESGDLDDDAQSEAHNGTSMREAIERARLADDLPDACYLDSMTAFADHVLADHDEPDAHSPDVCPICVSLPHGDPDRVVADLYEHLRRRHGFDWTLYAPDPRADEYEILARVMRDSLRDAAPRVNADD
jgi:hypothetical protein